MARPKRGSTGGASSKIANAMPAGTKTDGTQGKHKAGPKKKTNATPGEAKGTTRSQVEQPAVIDRDVEEGDEGSFGKIKDTTDSYMAMASFLRGIADICKAGLKAQVYSLAESIDRHPESDNGDGELQILLQLTTGVAGRLIDQLEKDEEEVSKILGESAIANEEGDLGKVGRRAKRITKNAISLRKGAEELTAKVGWVVARLQAAGVEMTATSTIEGAWRRGV